MLGLASDPFAFSCMENALAPFVVSSDLSYSKRLLLWSESFLGRKPKGGLAGAPIENVYSSLLW